MATRRLEKITERNVRTSQPGDVLSEKCTRGLLLQVSPRGVRAWVVRYRGHPEPGRKTTQRSMGLGSWPGVSVADARERANDARARVAKGEDPLRDNRQEAKRRLEAAARIAARQTFQKAAERFYAAVVDPEYRSRKNARRLLQYAADSVVGGRRFGDIPVSDITPEDAIELYTVLGWRRRNNDPRAVSILANRVIRLLGRFWKWAARPNGVPDCRNLPSPFDAIDLKTERERERVLADDELGAIWRVACRLGWPGGSFIKLAMLTGCRGREVLGLRWTPDPEGRFGYVDAKAGWLHFPAGATKNGRPHFVYINQALRDVLREIPRRFEGPFLLGKTGAQAAALRPGLKRRADGILAADGINLAPWVFHDLRRSMVTGLQRLGVAEHVVRKLINHAGQKTAFAAYTHHDYEQERRAALDLWATHIAELVSQPAAKSA